MIRSNPGVSASSQTTHAIARWDADSRYRHQSRLLRHLVDLVTWLYTFGGYLLSLYLVTRPGWMLPLAGVPLMAHTMILSALLTHECMHGTMSKRPALNAHLGRASTLISGACYVPYALLRRQHLDHHRNRVGYDGFSITRWVASLPPALRRVVMALEWCYVPVLSYVARFRSLAMPFLQAQHRPLRTRIAIVLLLRGACYLALLSISPWSWLWIFCAHGAMLTILRIYDCFHHTFEVIALGTPMPRLERDYEQRNTYSSLISREHMWLNRIFLNYGFHNAHHAFPNAHWTDLARIDAALYPASRAHCIHRRELLRGYHRHRVARILEGLGRPEVIDGKLVMDRYYGIVMNISFIVYDV
ncbi:fatty acid desaturase family protein [Burkholderia stabilis]|uniref:fatty acid desaturase family protein n=1 Tax=Burkholderia stabilis TaxID=95485 RepID=UPI001F4A25D8|nr:fatty acid desaturase [Burkholderia stabilis]